MHNNEQGFRPLETQIEFCPKTYEIDFAGVVSNIVHIKWLEDLRLSMLAKYLPLPELMKNEIVPVILKTEIKYKHPINLFDRISGALWLTNLGRSSWELSAVYTILESNKIATEATQFGVFVNIKSQKPVPVPESLRNLFQKERIRSGSIGDS